MIRPVCLVMSLLAAAPAAASCRIAGDCIALGLGQQLGGCDTDAAVGIPAAAVVARAQGPSVDWLVVSAGSNDVPRALAAVRFARARASIEASLDAILAARGTARLVVILPANGARAIVAAWAAGHGVASVPFAAGADGIHPRSYRALARLVLALMAAAS